MNITSVISANRSRNSGTSGSFGILAENDDKHPHPDIESLDAYALERWEVLLLLLARSVTDD